jgi:hypothetical protein
MRARFTVLAILVLLGYLSNYVALIRTERKIRTELAAEYPGCDISFTKNILVPYYVDISGAYHAAGQGIHGEFHSSGIWLPGVRLINLHEGGSRSMRLDSTP